MHHTLLPLHLEPLAYLTIHSIILYYTQGLFNKYEKNEKNDVGGTVGVVVSYNFVHHCV